MKKPDLKKLFGLKVRYLRRLKRLTQEELAEAIGRSLDTISNIERGFSSTRIETAAQIAKALGVSLPELFDLQEDLKDVKRINRGEIEQMTRLLNDCPVESLPRLRKWIEETILLFKQAR